MNSIFEKLADLNRRWNDLPRRAAIIAVTSICLIFVCITFKFIGPLIGALVFSWIIKPIALPVEKVFTKIKIPKKIAALIAVILVFGLLSALLFLLASVLKNELSDLFNSLPGFIRETSAYLRLQVNKLMGVFEAEGNEEIVATIYEMLMTGLNKLTEIVTGLAGTLMSFTWSAFTSIPDVIIVVLFTIMESYYIVADRDDIARFFNKWAPSGFGGAFDQVKKVMILGVRAQIVTALAQMVVAAVVLMIGFAVMDINYAVVLAMLIAGLDALPVIGAGLIMFPMMAYYAVIGDYMMMLGAIVLYFLVQVIKRVMEPKILGKQMRLNQLATMISMYAGYKLLGFIGIVVGPLLLMLFTVVLNITAAKPAEVTEEAKPVSEGE